MSAEAPDPRVATALEGARCAFLEHVEERRLRLFRGCLQASVELASPLALSFARHAGVGLNEILQVMTPPSLWPQSTGPLALPRVRWQLPTRRAWLDGGDDRLMWRIARTGGYAMRVGGAGDWVGWRVSGDAIEVAARLGSATLVTNRGTLRMWLPHSLPATLCTAAPGRQLTSLVKHALLTEDDLKVLSVDDHSGGGHVLRVRAGHRQFTPPWPGLLAGLLVTHANPSLAARYRREV